MPRKNFYLSDADAEIYEKAKEYVGESLSGFIVDSLRRLVQEREDKDKELTEVRLWIGEQDRKLDIKTGEYVKFRGRLLGTGLFVHVDIEVEYELYETRKNNFLLYMVETKMGVTVTSSYKTYKDYAEVLNLKLPAKLLNEAEAKLKDFKCIELDI